MVDDEQFTPNELDTMVSQLEKQEFEQPIDPEEMEEFLINLMEALQDPEKETWGKVSEIRHHVSIQVNADGTFTAQQSLQDMTPEAHWEPNNPNHGLQLRQPFWDLERNFTITRKGAESWDPDVLTIARRDFGATTFSLTQFVDPERRLKLVRVVKVIKLKRFSIFERKTIYILIKS